MENVKCFTVEQNSLNIICRKQLENIFDDNNTDLLIYGVYYISMTQRYLDKYVYFLLDLYY